MYNLERIGHFCKTRDKHSAQTPCSLNAILSNTTKALNLDGITIQENRKLLLFPNRFCLATYWKISLGPKQCNCSIGILAGSKHWGTVPQTLTNHQTVVSQPGESSHQNLYGICSITDTNQSTPIGSHRDTPAEARCLHCLQPLCAYTGSCQPACTICTSSIFAVHTSQQPWKSPCSRRYFSCVPFCWKGRAQLELGTLRWLLELDVWRDNGSHIFDAKIPEMASPVFFF